MTMQNYSMKHTNASGQINPGDMVYGGSGGAVPARFSNPKVVTWLPNPTSYENFYDPNYTDNFDEYGNPLSKLQKAKKALKKKEMIELLDPRNLNPDLVKYSSGIPIEVIEQLIESYRGVTVVIPTSELEIILKKYSAFPLAMGAQEFDIENKIEYNTPSFSWAKDGKHNIQPTATTWTEEYATASGNDGYDPFRPDTKVYPTTNKKSWLRWKN